MKQKILYTSAEVRNTIIDIFGASKGRRVAITAFVGSGSEAYLPKPNGIELVCWPKAGGTNPNALKKLIKKGVAVSFVNSLHMKIYWTEDKGVVLTSANLSTNALGAGDLREIGVWLLSTQVDINKILQAIKPKPATPKDLIILEKVHRDYQTRNKFISAKSEKTTFLEWYDRGKSKWKVGHWENSTEISKAAKSVSKKEYGLSSPETALSCTVNQYKRLDWILKFRLSSNKPTNIRWQPVDYVVRVPKSEEVYDSNYPYEACQTWPSNRYPPPPFQIDEDFRNAFTIALQKFGVKKYKDNDISKPPKLLIDLILENY